ncbi:DUF4102 domain-containing protein [Cereibacter sphaeroides]|nr:DUF4102 domain-containing protein [Cereibacter sphaeroides]
MRRPAKSLTWRAVQTATVPGKYFDGHGLFLRIDKAGTKVWVQRIMIQGKRTELGLGSPDFVSLAEAREKAYANRRCAREGGNPLQVKKEAAEVMTFEEAARKVHEIHKPTWRNEKHAAQFISTLEAYAFPKMGKVKMSQVSSADILAALTPIWLEKPETARRVKQRIGTVMKWGIAKGWRKDNPVETIAKALPKQADGKQHRKSLSYNDVARCLDAIQTSNAGISTKLCFELLLLCCVRSAEAREAVWSEFDLVAKVWTIPMARMKAKRDHRVPLAPRALALLEQAKGIRDGSDLVFPGSKTGRPLSDATLLKLVREKGFEVDVHGFRTSFRTWAQEKTNFPREVAEAALAHQAGDATERAYARSDLFEKRRKLMNAWASFIAEQRVTK